MNTSFENRIANVEKLMAQHGLDAAIIYADAWRPGNVSFLTGFREGGGGVSQAYTMLLLGGGKRSLVVGFEMVLEARVWANGVSDILGSDELDAALSRLKGARKLGVVGLNIMPYALHQTVLGRVQPSELVDFEPQFAPLRWKKSPADIAAMKKAFAITDRAIELAVDAMHEGATEQQLWNAGMSHIYSQNSVASFLPTVGIGARTSHAVTWPTTEALRPDSLVMLDFGAAHEGYYSDVTRTVGFRLKDEKLRALHDIAEEAFLSVAALVKPGERISRLEQEMRSVIASHGYGEYILHNFGHGIGFDQEEKLDISLDSSVVIEEDMTFTIEPGIYVPSRFGYRLEQAIHVTATGYECFSRLPAKMNRD